MLRTICRVWITPRVDAECIATAARESTRPWGEIAIDRPGELSLTSAHAVPPIHASQDFANTSRLGPQARRGLALAAPGRAGAPGRGASPSQIAPLRLRLGRQVHDRPADRS